MGAHEGAAEYFKRISELKTKKDKIQELRKPVDYSSIYEAIVDLCYNKKYIWLLPNAPASVVKKQPKAADLQTMLFSSMRKIKPFLAQNGYDNISRTRREQLWLQFLESLDPDDVDLMESIRLRKMPYKSLNQKLFEEAFPNLLEKWRSVKN